MTTVELHEILDDENKKITIKEYKEILFQLKWDIQDKLCELTKEEDYIKACDLCVKLFKGESDESICDKE